MMQNICMNDLCIGIPARNGKHNMRYFVSMKNQSVYIVFIQFTNFIYIHHPRFVAVLHTPHFSFFVHRDAIASQLLYEADLCKLSLLYSK